MKARIIQVMHKHNETDHNIDACTPTNRRATMIAETRDHHPESSRSCSLLTVTEINGIMKYADTNNMRRNAAPPIALGDAILVPKDAMNAPITTLMAT